MKKVISILSIAAFVIFVVMNINVALYGEKDSKMSLSDAVALANKEKPKKKIKYSYDAAGNRTKREVVEDRSTPSKNTTPKNEKGNKETSAKKTNKNNSNNQENTDTKFSSSENDLFAEKKITIYPNPTQGLLKVDIIGEVIPADAKIYLYNVQGALVRQATGISATNELDISEQPAGIYVMRIMLGKDNVSTWKIVKE